MIKELWSEGKTPQQIVDALNDETVIVIDDHPFTVGEIKNRLGSAVRAGEVIGKLDKISKGEAPLPDGVPAEIQPIVAAELESLYGSGLDLSDPGTNSFLRLIGADDVADLGRRTETPWQAAGYSTPATLADVESTVAMLEKVKIVNETRALSKSRDTALCGWLDVLEVDDLTIEQVKEECDSLLGSANGNGAH